MSVSDPAWSPDLRKAQAYERLLTDIVLGDLPPGGAVDERRIAQRYGVGLAPAREALSRLALEGFVVRPPRVGATVAPIDLQAVEEAFEVRRLLEGRSAALAARNATAADHAAIAAAFQDAERAVRAGDVRALIQMDRAFHAAVAVATHNVLLARTLITVQTLATRFWAAAMGEQSQTEQLADVTLHLDLARAIEARDPGAAEAAMARLIGDPPSLYPPDRTGPVRRLAATA